VPPGLQIPINGVGRKPHFTFMVCLRISHCLPVAPIDRILGLPCMSMP
jgi:hypothetical protein